MKRNYKPKFKKEDLGVNNFLSETPIVELESNVFTGFIYFVSDEENVKIGYTNNIEKRINQLQTGNAKELKLLFFIKGNKKVEEFLHGYFKEFHVKGEWFKINEYINEKNINDIVSSYCNFLFNDSNYTKIYTCSKNRKHIMKLSTRAKELYLWLIYELEKNEDYVWINVDRYMEECDISSTTTYQNTIKDLQKFGVICPTVVKDVYWINPLFFFNGSRIEKYPTKVKTK